MTVLRGRCVFGDASYQIFFMKDGFSALLVHRHKNARGKKPWVFLCRSAIPSERASHARGEALSFDGKTDSDPARIGKTPNGAGDLADRRDTEPYVKWFGGGGGG